VDKRVRDNKYVTFGKKPGDLLNDIYRFCVEKMNLPNPSEPLILKDGTLFARKYNRVVIGHYGPYIEVNPEDMVAKLTVPANQKWRLKVDENWKGRPLKYEWHVTKCGIKIYFQRGLVKYADYKKGKFYVHTRHFQPTPGWLRKDLS